MIHRLTGEVAFDNGLILRPQALFSSILPPKKGIRSKFLPVSGWLRFYLGIQQSDHGDMEVELVCGPDLRLHMIVMAHSHSFYRQASPEDSERRAFHEEIILRDLAGQKEFSWGTVRCATDPAENKNWMVIAYTPGANVPLADRKALLQLAASEKPA